MKFYENKLILSFLNLASIVFKTLSFINLKIKSWRQKKYDEVVIVSLDNLSFGGTGKTSLTSEVSRSLQEKGIKFAVVSRGYRSKYEKSGVSVRLDHKVEEVGDEAKLLKTRFPDRDILIGRNRHDSIKKAAAKGNRAIILDDGFQSTDIHKDIKIMLFNPLHPYYYLRNFKFLMKDEDYVLSYDPEGAEKSDRGVVWAPGRAVSGSYYFERDNFYDAGRKVVNIGDSVLFGFSALGDNRRFRDDLLGFQLAGFLSFRDHHFFTEEDIKLLEEKRKAFKADYLACTEKDYVKLTNYNLASIPLIFAKNVIKYNIDLTGIILNYAAKKKADKLKA
ncbi:MAG: tetraacyldisaccharide 4'-kinase [Candidatus Aminicenantes bacterium]|nr:tetraacyldisaccharide 4'-kinase [Candidatus Aminicenantes bacterium]